MAIDGGDINAWRSGDTHWLQEIPEADEANFAAADPGNVLLHHAAGQHRAVFEGGKCTRGLGSKLPGRGGSFVGAMVRE